MLVSACRCRCAVWQLASFVQDVGVREGQDVGLARSQVQLMHSLAVAFCAPPGTLLQCSSPAILGQPLQHTCQPLCLHPFPTCRMMRQAGRYQKAYRDLALKHPSFRERSENTDLIVEISLQPWESFKPDGVILFRCPPAIVTAAG